MSVWVSGRSSSRQSHARWPFQPCIDSSRCDGVLSVHRGNERGDWEARLVELAHLGGLKIRCHYGGVGGGRAKFAVGIHSEGGSRRAL